MRKSTLFKPTPQKWSERGSRFPSFNFLPPRHRKNGRNEQFLKHKIEKFCGMNKDKLLLSCEGTTGNS